MPCRLLACVLAACLFAGTARRPVIMVAGVQKGGTSSLSSWLFSQFPGFFSPPLPHCRLLDGNESRFFIPYLSPCYSWEMFPGHPLEERCGLSLFDTCFMAENGQRGMEKSPDNIFWPHVWNITAPWLRHEMTRVILLLRDPVSRFISDAGQTLLQWVTPYKHGPDHSDLLIGLIGVNLDLSKVLLKSLEGI